MDTYIVLCFVLISLLIAAVFYILNLNKYVCNGTDKVCVTTDDDFCMQFPAFTPGCEWVPPDIDPVCPSLCNDSQFKSAFSDCYTKKGCDSRDQNGKWSKDGPFNKCNIAGVLCESKKCKWASCSKPKNTCLSKCEEARACFDVSQATNACVLWDQNTHKFTIPDEAPDDIKEKLSQCNIAIDSGCNPEYGCDWATCDAGPTPDDTDCVEGKTFNTDTGKEPCNNCSTSCPDGKVIDKQCTVTSDITCKDDDSDNGCPESCVSGEYAQLRNCFVDPTTGSPATSCMLWKDGKFDDTSSFWPTDPDKQEKLNKCNEGIKICNVDVGCDWATC